jgi:hypothetical protein
MHWIAPSGNDSATDTLGKRLWDAADQFRANSGLSAAQSSQPILGLIFLRFAEVRFNKQRAILEKAGASSRRGARVDEPGAYHADEHYNLDAIISVGYRVKSAVATRFRIGATQRLRELIVKGFVLDDERLNNPDQPFDYFDACRRIPASPKGRNPSAQGNALGTRPPRPS